jgi:ABC-type multidrug transport system fused ATPase/permease subunit
MIKKKNEEVVLNQAAKQLSKKLRAKFIENNYMNYTGAVVATLLIVVLNLIISWLLQQIIDAATGNNEVFTLTQLLMISIGHRSCIDWGNAFGSKNQSSFCGKGHGSV